MKVKLYIYLHSIFCTSRHLNLIANPDRMKQLLLDVFEFYNCELIESSISSNHVHLLHSASAEMSTDELLKKIKLAVQTKYQREVDFDFYWEPGYYLFSISGDLLEAERMELLKQTNMHKQQSLEVELKKYRDEFKMEESNGLTDLDENRFN